MTPRWGVRADLTERQCRQARTAARKSPTTGTKKEAPRKGVPVRDYKKIKNILMGTPASASNKEGSDFSESSLF